MVDNLEYTTMSLATVSDYDLILWFSCCDQFNCVFQLANEHNGQWNRRAWLESHAIGYVLWFLNGSTIDEQTAPPRATWSVVSFCFLHYKSLKIITTVFLRRRRRCDYGAILGMMFVCAAHRGASGASLCFCCATWGEKGGKHHEKGGPCLGQVSFFTPQRFALSHPMGDQTWEFSSQRHSSHPASLFYWGQFDHRLLDD